MNLLPVVLLLNRMKKNGENINRSAVFIALCLIFDIYAVVPTHMRQWTAMAPIKKERFVQHSPAFYLQNVLYILYVASSIQPECGLWCLMPVMRILRVLYHIDRLLERTRADVFFSISRTIQFVGIWRLQRPMTTTTSTSTPNSYVQSHEHTQPRTILHS